MPYSSRTVTGFALIRLNEPSVLLLATYTGGHWHEAAHIHHTNLLLSSKAAKTDWFMALTRWVTMEVLGRYSSWGLIARGGGVGGSLRRGDGGQEMQDRERRSAAACDWLHVGGRQKSMMFMCEASKTAFVFSLTEVGRVTMNAGRSWNVCLSLNFPHS